MNITEHLEACKALIEQLPSQPKVQLFSGTLTAENIKDLSLDGQRCYVLLGCGGGPIPPKKERMGLECDAVFGAFVVAKSDPDTKGVSRQAMTTANEILIAFDNYRGNIKTNPNLPELQLIEELFSGMKGNTNFSAWQVVWTQRIKLS
ncbi:hypothetical protein AAZU54_08335 [Pseudomonas sp. Je.1.5.c]|uniref:hypothetical protein n=1 Tax=Pseudomonas sp. Je.1.5.c TaxID=3142839 RepID=UPI003DA875E9